ncbi:hypothetical protein SKAU_G00009970 [Synaphobranchus kaupii]|uniref:Uncharacterized protein n=1 Tax=Synaphobranchus kaupii TaxID=118154 RepID=A0A9Q1JDE8_SYNKA|nr:hypothetical protein SKAU_G00009970 [Synaphobranchus kaupii]
MKPKYRPPEKNRPPEERETANKERAGQGVSSTPPGPNFTPELSKRWLRKSSYLPARKKIQLPVIPFWKGAPYARPLVKYTSALPLRRARLRRKAPHPLSTSWVTFAKPEVTLRVLPRLRSGQAGTSQKRHATQDRAAGMRQSLRPRPGPAQTRSQAPPNSPQPSRAREEGDRGADGAGMTKASKAVRSLQLCSPNSASNSSPSPPRPSSPLQRRRPRYLSRRYLQQMEWYRALRKEKKLRDARKRLDELCSEVTTHSLHPRPVWVAVQLKEDSLKKGLSGASARLGWKDKVRRVLIPGPADCSADTPGSSQSKDPVSKKRKLSPQSSGSLLPSCAGRQKRPLRRSWKLDSSSSSSDTGSAITPAETPDPSSVCTPPAGAFLPLAPAAAPISCASAEANGSRTDTSPNPRSSTDPQSHAAPDASTSSLSKDSPGSAAPATSGASLAKDSHSDSTPPTGSAPASEDRHARMRLPVETSSLKSPTPPARNEAVAGRVSESEQATEPCEQPVNTVPAALKSCAPADSASKTARSQPAEERKEPNPSLNDKAKAASDIKHLTAAENQGSHLHPITGKPESGSQFSAKRKCQLSKSAATNRPPSGLKTSCPDTQSGFLNKADKIEISPSLSGRQKQHDRPVNKKCPCPTKTVHSATFALPCKASKLKRRSAIQAMPTKAEETGRKASVRKTTADPEPASKTSLKTLTKKASLSVIAPGPSRAFYLNDGAVARASSGIKAHRYKSSGKTKPPSPSLSCEVCPVCQCSPLLESAPPSAAKVSLGIPTPKRTPKPKRRPPPWPPSLQDWSAVVPPLFSVLTTHESVTKQTPAKHPPTLRLEPKTTRRGPETGSRSADPVPLRDGSSRQKSHTAGSHGPLRHAAAPRLSSPSTHRLQPSGDARTGRRNRAVAKATEPQSLTGRDTPRIKKTKNPHAPKTTHRKTLFGGGDHRGSQGGSAQKAGRDSVGTAQSRRWDKVTAAPRIRSHKGAPHSRDHTCRIMTNYPAVAEADLLTGRDGSPEPPSAAPRAPSPELIETLVSVMSSLLGLHPSAPGALHWDPHRNARLDQEESCPAGNLGFLMRLQTKR